MNHSIFILLQNVSVKNNRLEFCFIMISSESGLLHRLSIFSSESPTEITEKLSEWVSQGQLMDTTMTISKLEYVDRTRQLNIVCGVNSIQDWENQQKCLAQESYFFLSVIMSDCMTVFFLYKIRENVQYKVGLFLFIHFILFIELILSLVGDLPWGLASPTLATQAVPGISFSSKIFFQVGSSAFHFDFFFWGGRYKIFWERLTFGDSVS